jgi:hypothetical protein
MMACISTFVLPSRRWSSTGAPATSCHKEISFGRLSELRGLVLTFLKVIGWLAVALLFVMYSSVFLSGFVRFDG